MKNLKQYHASSFFKRLFTPRELHYFKLRFVGPMMHGQGEQQRIANYLAGRWAAKEACVKAIKPRKLTHSEIEIWPDVNKETYAIILDEPATPETSPALGKSPAKDDDYSKAVTKDDSDEDYREQAEQDLETRFKDNRNPNLNPLDIVPSHEKVEGQMIRVSISHDSDYACAVALWVDSFTSDGSTQRKIKTIENELERLRRAK